MVDIHPAPYPADTRAKGWRFELDMEKIKASETWLRSRSGAIKGALLLLWAESWQQEPCGSLPNDDELIALLIDMPTAAFLKCRPVLMRGWYAAEDGRLYHPTVGARVLEMLSYRKKTAERVAKHKLALREQQGANALPTSDSSIKNDTGTGTGTGSKDLKTKPLSAAPTVLEGFAKFWSEWPKSTRKVGKDQCAVKWKAKGCEEIADQIIAALEAFKACDEWQKEGGQFIPAPLVWLNQCRWEASSALVADGQTEGFI